MSQHSYMRYAASRPSTSSTLIKPYSRHSDPQYGSKLNTYTYSSIETIEMSLWDTAGQEDYDRLRPLSYTSTNVVLITFAIDSPTSLNNVRLRWHPEIQHFLPGIPLLLVGCKSDLRLREGCIPYGHCEAVAREIGACAYIECSAKLGWDIDDVFIRAAMESTESKRQQKKRTHCVIL